MSRGFASAAAVAEVLNQCYGKRLRIAKVGRTGQLKIRRNRVFRWCCSVDAQFVGAVLVRVRAGGYASLGKDAAAFE